MSKEKVCPYKNTGDCPDLQKAVKETSKNKRKKKEIFKRTSSFPIAEKDEICSKCNGKIKKGTKFVKWLIRKQIGEHVNDLDEGVEEFVCVKCTGIEKI